MGIGEEWYHLNIDGRMGFMQQEFLEDTDQVSEYLIGPFQSPVR
jgi:hypothetical protein